MPPIFEFLSLRTFSSVWYWIVVAAVWASVSHRPMGVPYDMVGRARRDERARSSLEAVARTLAHRLSVGIASGGAILVATLSALLTGLLLLAVVYGSELAQGAVLVVLPLSLVGWLTVRTARTIDGGGEPARHLRRLRMATNAIGVVALFVTAVWGMYVNFVTAVL